MSCWIVPPIAGLMEPAIAPEFFIDGIGAVELVGATHVCLYFYREQLPLDGGEAVRTVIYKSIVPLASLPANLAKLAHCLAQMEGPPERSRPRAVV